MNKLFLCIAFTTISLTFNIASADNNSLGAAASAKHTEKVDSSPQLNTKTEKYGAGFSEAKRAAGRGKHRIEVDATPSFHNSDASDQSRSNTEKHGSGFSEAKREAGRGRY